jgi:hypothetical protein
MDDNKTTPTSPPPHVVFPWVPTDEGIFQCYSNFIDAAWTLFDVTVRFAQIVPTPAGSDHKFDAEEIARITVAWPEAKILALTLSDLVRRYEETNGEIKPLKLTPGPADDPKPA